MPRTELYCWSKPLTEDAGPPFDDINAYGKLGKISEIKIRYGEIINSIQCVYAGKEGSEMPKHGGNGGGEGEPFRLPDDEYITAIKLRTGIWGFVGWGVIASIQFFTNTGRASMVYGSEDSSSWSKEHHIEFPGNAMLTSIFGNSGDFLHKIGFVYDEDPVKTAIMTSLSFNQDLLKDKRGKPKAVMTILATNNTSLVQTAKIDETQAVSQSFSITDSTSFREGLKFSLGGEGVFLKGGFEVSFDATQTHSFGETNTTTRTLHFGEDVKVPPMGAVVATLSVTESKVNVPYTGKLTLTHRSGRVEEDIDVSGMFEGMLVSRARVSADEVDPNSVDADGYDHVLDADPAVG